VLGATIGGLAHGAQQVGRLQRNAEAFPDSIAISRGASIICRRSSSSTDGNSTMSAMGAMSATRATSATGATGATGATRSSSPPNCPISSSRSVLNVQPCVAAATTARPGSCVSGSGFTLVRAALAPFAIVGGPVRRSRATGAHGRRARLRSPNDPLDLQTRQDEGRVAGRPSRKAARRYLLNNPHRI